MGYAVVDIETTGGKPGAGTTTEIAVRISDGAQLLAAQEWLIKPAYPIPPYITRLTGISMEMVQHAPDFSAIAGELFALLQGHIFVAHNVAFDSTFLQREFEAVGLDFRPARLCTLRMARKIWKALPSYSLGNLCSSLGIAVENRHRAGGDADAALALLHRICDTAGPAFLQQSVGRKRALVLPAGLDMSDIPTVAGVYTFYDFKDRPLYIGMAHNLHKRIASHFRRDGKGQEMLQKVKRIGTEPTGNAAMAVLWEQSLIAACKPEYNVQGKFPGRTTHIIRYQTLYGAWKLALTSGKTPPGILFSCNSQTEGRNLLLRLMRDSGICQVYNHNLQDRCEEPSCYCYRTDANRSAEHSRKILLLSAEEDSAEPKVYYSSGGREAHQCAIVYVHGRQKIACGFVTEAPANIDQNVLAKLRPVPDTPWVRTALNVVMAEWNWKLFDDGKIT